MIAAPNREGTMAPGATVDLKAADFQRVLNVNVLGPFLCARESLKRMKERGGGRIINIGSISAYSPRPDGAIYTTSKFALQGLSQSLSLDARPYNVAVGIIHPGNVRSELLSADVIYEREKAEGFIEPEDVAQCVLSMASLPYSVNILELTVIPTKQPLVGRG
jgi:NAD(P)-dependent dehydrogenase (short-subunit alcohol dehydrogenase family)